jgi:N-acetylglucosaminylphosphatidylinositol deacetylase
MNYHITFLLVYHGVSRSVIIVRQIYPNIVFLELESTNILRKFLGIFDLILTKYLGGKFNVYNINLLLVMSAMWCHKSQFTWYRFLFIIFSRFTYSNNFKEIGEKCAND